MQIADEVRIRKITIFASSAKHAAVAQTGARAEDQLDQIDTSTQATAEELAVLAKQALEDKSASLRLTALQEFNEKVSDDAQRSDVVISAMNDEDSKVRTFALGAMQDLDMPPEGLISNVALTDKDPSIRMRAFDTLLSVYGDSGARPVLQQALSDPESSVREAAQNMLKYLDTPSHAGVGSDRK
jgi:hypothetical protein